MGDTGSLALGGGITAAAIVMKMELLLPIVGLIYVLEVVSVIMQVCYFKATHGKRIFRMTPLHHHFQEGGMKETRVVFMFWTITLICCIIGRASVM
jgi:phospho-N-acetylmuramoyl-pentapeptide-transferase